MQEEQSKKERKRKMDQKNYKDDWKEIGKETVKKILIATGVCLGVKLIFTAGSAYGTAATIAYCKQNLGIDILAEAAKRNAK